MRPYYLTVWSSEKHDITAGEQYLHHTLGGAVAGGLEQCDSLEGSFSIVFFDTAKGTSEDKTEEGWRDFQDDGWFRRIEFKDGQIFLGELKSDSAPISERRHGHDAYGIQARA